MFSHIVLLLYYLSVIISQEYLAIELTLKVIESIADNHGGHFTWWIYNLEAADDGFVTALLEAPHIRNIPRQVLSTTSMTVVNPLEHAPSLIVIRCVVCGPRNDWEHLKYANVSVETRILVVHQCEGDKQFEWMFSLFEKLKLVNTVFLDLEDNMIVHAMVFKRELVVISNFEVPPSELFVDHARDLYGYRISVSMSDPKPETTIFKKFKKVIGRDFQWIEQTADHLNGSVDIKIIDCSRLSTAECSSKRMYQSNKKQHDISLDPSYATRMKYFFIDGVEPDRSVIMVPGGQRLTPLEVFIVPFHLYVWVMLTLLVIACWTLVLYYANTFINDPILAALSGIERRSFHLTGKPEKMLILILSILFFIMLQAYETKIIAMMTSYPYMSDPRDLEDLERFGIKVRHIEGNSKYTFSNNAELQSLMQTVTTRNVSEIFKYAVIGEENLLKLIISISRHIYNRDGRFIILKDYHLGLAIRQYYMAQRSPLAKEFKRTQRIFFEVGLSRFWMDQVMHIYQLRARLDDFKAGVQLERSEGDGNLGIDEMAPAWYVILIGWLCSAAVCIFEVIYSRISYWKIDNKI
ncbi:uncharacterized protein LOC120413879 [Culex pipiens pallens]|uniref:uncharacterized protein LOC120413879 n=1 Tax=Culex pipiens pallens TaxID=42434 RepID=UPI0022AB4BA0|nr:uncharacterized protein LOC120413879 [Culex pipiens pallens]